MKFFKKVSSYIGFFLLILLFGLNMYAVLPLSKQALEERLKTQVVQKTEKTLKQVVAYLNESNKAQFDLPVFIIKEGKLQYWSSDRYSFNINMDITKSPYSFYEEDGVKGIIHHSSYQGQLIYILFPVLDQKKLLLNLGLKNLGSIRKISSINFPEEITFKTDHLSGTNDKPAQSWFQLILIVLACALTFNKIQSFFQKFNFFRNLGRSSVFVLYLIFFIIPTLFLDSFHSLWLTAPISKEPFNFLSPILLFLTFSFLLLIQSHIQSSKRGHKILFRSEWKRYFAGTIFIFLIATGTIIMILLIKYIYLKAGMELALERLYYFSIKELFFLLIFLLIFSNYFAFAQYIFRLISNNALEIKHKLPGILFSIILLSVCNFYIPLQFDILPFILSFLIFIISLDLYQDRRKLNSTWIFTWMILISAYLSFIIYSIDHSNDQKKLEQSIEYILKDRDKIFEQKILSGNLSFPVEKYRVQSYKLDSNKIVDWLFSNIMIEEDLYFNVLSGDYIQTKNSETSDSIQIRHYYSQFSDIGENRYEMPENYILFHNDQILIEQLSKDETYNESYVQDVKYGQDRKLKADFITYNGHSGLKIEIQKNRQGLLRPVSLFSLLFFILSIFLFSLSLLNTSVQILPQQLNLRFFERKSLRNRIQISIISLVIVSFFAIGVFTNFYLKNLAEKTDRIIQINESQLIQHDLNNLLKEKADTTNFSLQNYLTNKQILDRTNIFFYDTSGSLIKKQQFFNIDIVGNKILKKLPYHIFSAFENFQEDKNYWYKNSQHNGVYLALKNYAQEKEGFAFIQGKERNFNIRSISNIFAIFLNIYSFLFIISGAIAIALANSITNPIELLGKKLKDLKLSNKNETVEWKNEDEIGSLITIYNEMIYKLSDNAKVMAKVERDSAWKEMAKQVAHEIKNPLTPLKLNIQYLESKVRMNPEEASQLIEQIAPSLIEQIDNLSEIASEFSNFAQLPTARNEKIRLNEIVKTVHDFFRKREDLNFQLFVPINDILVFADKNHLVRILNNVVKNAIQSIPSEREGEIIIRLYRKEDNAIIQVTDNGTGIPKEMHDKVFSPNFTTKSSGTGLGLAISTNMLESFSGSIYFETVENEGTDFFIEIPLMRLEDNYPEGSRVILDE